MNTLERKNHLYKKITFTYKDSLEWKKFNEIVDNLTKPNICEMNEKPLEKIKITWVDKKITW